jgi:hypothetical protein
VQCRFEGSDRSRQERFPAKHRANSLFGRGGSQLPSGSLALRSFTAAKHKSCYLVAMTAKPAQDRSDILMCWSIGDLSPPSDQNPIQESAMTPTQSAPRPFMSKVPTRGYPANLVAWFSEVDYMHRLEMKFANLNASGSQYEFRSAHPSTACAEPFSREHRPLIPLVKPIGDGESLRSHGRSRRQAQTTTISKKQLTDAIIRMRNSCRPVNIE